jgi:hypothetical protein
MSRKSWRFSFPPSFWRFAPTPPSWAPAAAEGFGVSANAGATTAAGASSCGVAAAAAETGLSWKKSMAIRMRPKARSTRERMPLAESRGRRGLERRVVARSGARSVQQHELRDPFLRSPRLACNTFLGLWLWLLAVFSGRGGEETREFLGELRFKLSMVCEGRRLCDGRIIPWRGDETKAETGERSIKGKL